MESILCIPRIDTNTTNQYIYRSLRKLNWGHISILNEIPLRNDPTQKRVMVKVKWNHDTDIKSKIDNGETIKFVHDINSPWFWKIMRASTDSRNKNCGFIDACIQSS